MNKTGPVYKRRIYFIEKSFQSKFILRFCGLVSAAGLLTIALIYFLAMRSTTVSIVNSRVLVKTTADFLLPLLLQTVGIVMIAISLATIIVTLLASHKIAGPLYRFKKALADLSEGDFSGEVKIRRFDQLQDLAVSFTDMITKTRGELKAIKDNIAALKERAGNIPDADIRRIADELNRIISRFKI